MKWYKFLGEILFTLRDILCVIVFLFVVGYVGDAVINFIFIIGDSMENIDIIYPIGGLIVGALVGYWQRARKYQAGKKLVKNAAQRLTAFSAALDDDHVSTKEFKETVKAIQDTASDIKDVVT